MEVNASVTHELTVRYPDDWPPLTFDDLFEFQNGVNADKSDYGAGTQFINVLEVITHAHIRETDIPGRVRLSEPRQRSYAVQRGDVVFNRTSETQEEVGLAAVYEGDTPVVFGGFVIRGRPKGTAIDGRYAGYALRAHDVRRQIIAAGQGGIRANIGQGDLRKVVVHVPSIPEQQAIAKALSNVDELIQSLERLIAKKRDIKQAAMQQLLTGQTRLPGFSGEWCNKTFADLFNFSGGYSASREQLSQSGHCYLHYGDIHGTSSTYVDVEADFHSIPKLDVSLTRVNNGSLLDDGDVVFVDASEDVDGTSRHVVVKNPRGVPFISGLHTIVAKSKGPDLDNEYKRFCFQPEETKRQFRFYAVGTKVSGVSKTNVAKITLRFPGIAEQRAIAEVLSDMDAEIEALETRLAKTRALKQGMMQELLTGGTRLV